MYKSYVLTSACVASLSMPTKLSQPDCTLTANISGSCRSNATDHFAESCHQLHRRYRRLEYAVKPTLTEHSEDRVLVVLLSPPSASSSLPYRPACRHQLTSPCQLCALSRHLRRRRRPVNADTRPEDGGNVFRRPSPNPQLIPQSV